MLFMVIEHFKDRDALEIYRRFKAEGRKLPEGLCFVDSWVEANCARCFQLMECDDVRLLQVWSQQWRDVTDFDFIPVVSGKDTAAALAPLIEG